MSAIKAGMRKKEENGRTKRKGRISKNRRRNDIKQQ